MDWFDDQLRERHRNDTEGINESCKNLAGIVNQGSRAGNYKYNDPLDEICGFYHMKGGEVPSGVENINERMDYIFKPLGVMRRRVTLSGKWWKEIDGVLLCEMKDGGAVALLPNAMGYYTFYDYTKGVQYRLGEKTAQMLETEAVCFYEPLPQRALETEDVLKYMLRSFTKMDLIRFLTVSCAAILLGMVMPGITALLFNVIVPSGEFMFIYTIGFMLIGVAVSKFLFSALKSGYLARMQQKMKIRMRNAVFARVLTLPTDFFKQSGSGEMTKRVAASEELCLVFGNIVFVTGLAMLMTLAYFFQIFAITPALVVPVLVIILVQLVLGISQIVLKSKNFDTQLKADARLSGVVFSIFSGIQKIKVSGGEPRAYMKWARAYREKADAVYNKPFILKISAAIEPAVSVFGMLLIYSFAYGKVSLAEYVAFNTAYGMVSSSLATLIQTFTYVGLLKPILDLMEPILKAQPDARENKEVVKNISGNIELNNVSFRYTKDGPLILDSINLIIKKGQYVAIVGTTGCGKSTLMRLMLGFETPEIGAVYYDKKNLQKIDINSLRRHIGVVLQNGKLMTDDIFSNIAISAPGLTMSEAWEAAEMAGVADDIRNMPMQMNTIISEGGGGISGGQRQRLLIARAIAHKPRVLMLDEATSALDNLTQKKVSDSLDRMKCTRIVIAHRLSTIRQCDRIIVLDQGKIVEDGTYDELISQNGKFAELVARQRLDND